MFSPNPTACHLGSFLSAFQFTLNRYCVSYLSLHNDRHRTQGYRTTINLYHLTAPVGQELKTNMWKARGSDFSAAAQRAGKQEVGGSHWLVAILKSRATQATPNEN